MGQPTLRVIYMGTPAFAVPALERLAARDDVTIDLVVTQPDRPAGRGRKLMPPPVREAADRLGLPVMQVATLRDAEARRQIHGIAPDLVVVAAFGMILGKWILEIPRLGCVNLHASLLPAYRGANPVASAIAAGESVTGVTLMCMDRGLDTGPMLARTLVDIPPDATTESLTAELADAAGELLARSFVDLREGNLVPEEQPAGATLTRPMTKDDGWIDWSRPANDLERHVRAMWPWPRAWTTTGDGTRVQVHAVNLVPGGALEPGHIVHDAGRVLVGTGSDALELARVQLPGGTAIDGSAVANAKVLTSGAELGMTDPPAELLPLVVPVDSPA